MPGGEARTGTANHATMFFTVSPRPDVDDLMAASAYEHASDHLASIPKGAATARGYRLFWARGDDIGHKDIGEADYVVVGRHSACDIALPAAAELSLRHVLIATTKGEGGAPDLRVLDLRGSLPFYTDDGRPRRSIAASGPLVLRLGTYLIGGVPIGPDNPQPTLPPGMPRAIVTESLPPSPLASRGQRRTAPSDESSTIGGAMDADDFYDPPPAPPPPAPLEMSPHLSRVTVVPNATLLTEVVRADAPLAFARLTLLREGHSASIDLHTSDLDAGVLIGRSERCTDGGLRRVLDGNISRIHVLLLREGDDVIAYDLCSTQGTYDGGESIRRRRVSRDGGCISLAKTNPVMLCLHPRAEAPRESDPGPTPAP